MQDMGQPTRSAVAEPAGPPTDTASTAVPVAEPATVAICAYTVWRWENMIAAVESAVAQFLPGDECVVVIDHNRELYERTSAHFAGRAMIRTIESDGPKGLSGARNTAIATSRGAIVAFLDDDAVAQPGWLDGMRTTLSEPDVLGVGTAALPQWPGGIRPTWFPQEFYWVVGCSYVGMPTQRSDVRNVIGATMAFRREAFELAGNFSSVVGRVGATLTGCEETELCIRLGNAKPGARIAYLPDVSVAHTVTPDRLRLGYFLRRCYGEGRSKAQVSRMVGMGKGLSSERSYATSVLPRGVVRELRRMIRGHLSGLSAALLIIFGLLFTTMGYAEGRVSRWRLR